MENSSRQFLQAREIYSWGDSLVFAIAFVVLALTFLFRTEVVKGESMLPTLKNKDQLVTSALFYQPSLGDIVVIDSKGLDEAIVKRVIATQGQTVDINEQTGKVTVDGVTLTESYIAEVTRVQGYHKYPVTVPEGKLFVMGDNRNFSTDSRDSLVGFVDTRYVIGRVLLRFFPKFGAVN